MNRKMTTVAEFAETHLRDNGYLGYCRTLFIAENYPNLDTYFYRTLGSTFSTKQNQFFNNLVDALGLPPNPNEMARLSNFLNNGFRLIDAFINPEDNEKSDAIKMHPIETIYSDISLLNPTKIVFITKNNKGTIKLLTDHLAEIGDTTILPKIVPDYYRAEMFHSFPSTQYGKRNLESFNRSIALGMNLGLI